MTSVKSFFLLLLLLRTSLLRACQIQITSKNYQRYYTTKRLIRDLLSHTPNCYVRAGEFRGYLFTRNAWQKYAKRDGIGAGNHCRLTAFPRSIYQINLDQYSITSAPFRLFVVRKYFKLSASFFVTSIQFVACAFRENLSNRSSGIQIPRDICTRFGRYLYSTKCGWIIDFLINFLIRIPL